MSERAGTPSARLQSLFGVHDHQPVGNLHQVIAEATVSASHPVLAVVRGYPARETEHAPSSDPR